MNAVPATDRILIAGAREHNLRDITVAIPKRTLTVVTGVSGSGKSSLVFGTIAAESQRLVNETYSAFLQGMMPTPPHPDVDVLDGLTMSIAVDQERMGGNARSTLGTATDVHTALRSLFSRIAEPQIGGPKAYSFNVPSVSGQGAVKVARRDGSTVNQVRRFSVVGGQCPRCEGMGQVNELDLTQLFDDSLSLTDDLFTIPGYGVGGWNARLYRESGLYPTDRPIREFTAKQRDDFLYREPEKRKIAGVNMTYEGLVPRIQKSLLSKDRESMQPHVRAFVDRAVTFGECPECRGTRLAEPARTAAIDGVTIADAAAMPIVDLADWVARLDRPAVQPLVEHLETTLRAFVDIGLGYLSLDRSTGTLSGGESQRAKIVRHLGSPLTDVTYLFDEPSIGLHPHDVARIGTVLQALRDKGNTVIVVEHKPEVIALADHVIELGPGAGTDGGAVTYEGPLEGLRASGTVTGRHLDDRAELKSAVRAPAGHITINDATTNNLHGVTVDIPLGVLTVVTGVAGSGKSSLIEGHLAKTPDVVLVDQEPIRGNKRSTPATMTGIADHIRKLFATANGVKPALFSANSEGACPSCAGTGAVGTDVGPGQTFSSPCDDCEGLGFAPEVLAYTVKGRNIAEVFAMSIADASEFFTGEARLPRASTTMLGRLAAVGIGYIRLGQAVSTLSGGERQRLKLALRMSESAKVIILDEPTTGLHLADIATLLKLLDALVDDGITIVCVEHHQAVMAHADWIIDMGPGAGADGGRVVFTGTPAELVTARSTLTGEHLAAYLGVKSDASSGRAGHTRST